MERSSKNQTCNKDILQKVKEVLNKEWVWMTQYLIRTLTDSTGTPSTHVTKARENETFTVVEAESKEEAERIFNGKKDSEWIMKLKITSKSKSTYDIDWMASINDFTNWLDTTDDNFIKVIGKWDKKTFLKISEIEAISIWEDDQWEY